MPNEMPNPDQKTIKAAEEQLTLWENARKKAAARHEPSPRDVYDFISISRIVGLEQPELQAMLQCRLAWPVFERPVMCVIARTDRLLERVRSNLDERDRAWLAEYRATQRCKEIKSDDDFNRLTEVVLSIARKYHAVFVGRATDLMLPPEMGVRVRLMASRAYCVQRIAARDGASPEQAAQRIEEFESERTRYMRSHFGVEASEQTRHDVILNLARFSPGQVADLILSALYRVSTTTYRY